MMPKNCPYNTLKHVIMSLVTHEELKEKCNGNDIDSWLKEYLRFEENENEFVEPEKRLCEFFSRKKLFDVAEFVGIPEEECENDPREVLIEKIIEKLGFEVRLPPEGISQVTEEIDKCKRKVQNHINDDIIIKGSIVKAFYLLEKIFQKIFYAYARWRFPDNSSEKLFSVWVKNQRHQNWLKNHGPTLGQFRSVLQEVDETIQKNKDEKTRFSSNFERPYLLFPIGDNRLNISLPDIADFEQLQIKIKDRNAVVHYSETDDADVDALDLIEKIHALIIWFESENIFPDAVIMRYRIEYDNNMIRAGLYNDRKEMNLTYIDGPIDFNAEYYDMGTRSNPRFIKFTDNWKEILK